MAMDGIGDPKLQSWQVYLIFILVHAGILSSAQSEGEKFLQMKEQQVQQLAMKAVENFENTCELMASCTLHECSRAACYQQQLDSRHYQCPNVTNDMCNCNSLRADLNTSYVRVPFLDVGTSVRAERIAAICAQRKLDDTFRSFPPPSSYNNFYLGTVDGSFRYFPGTAAMECDGYDPRLRDWYMGAISVVKHVVVLVDVASSMGDDYGFLEVTTPLMAAISMTQQLLGTITEGDRATVLTYSGDGMPVSNNSYTELGVVVNNTDSSFQDLMNNLSKLTPSSVKGSNTTAAISHAQQVLGNVSPEGALKVIVVFTDGKSPSPQGQRLDGLVSSLNEDEISLFIYQIGDRDAGLRQFVCNLTRGYTEEFLISNFKNPLYDLLSYYGFLARVRMTVGSHFFWQQPYEDYGALGKVITVAYPAISSTGDLIGVAGIDIQVSAIESPLYEQINEALVSRVTRPPLIAPGPEFSKCDGGENFGSNNCSVPTPPVAICPDTKSNLTYHQRLCCPGCGGYAPPSNNKSLAPLWISLGVGGFLVTAGLVFLVWKRCREKPDFQPPSPVSLLSNTSIKL